MKPLFCIDITDGNNTEEFNGNEFITAQTEQYLLDEVEVSSGAVDVVIKKASLKLPLKILYYICAIGFIISFRVFLNFAFDGADALSNVFNKVPYVFFGGVACFVISLIIFFYNRKNRKRVLESEEAQMANNSFEQRAETIFQQLSVPSTALKMDVLNFTYKTKNGVIKFKGKGMTPTPIQVLEVRTCIENDSLNLATLDFRWSIPLTEIGEIEAIEKRIAFMGWNKEVPFNKGEYKQYKMGRDNGMTYMKPYYIVKINHNSEEFGLYLPCYEIENFKKIINRQ